MCAHKEAVTVAEMARMVGLSRARFYQLVGSAFPFPVYDLATRRPYYPARTPAAVPGGPADETAESTANRSCSTGGGSEVSRVRPTRSRRKPPHAADYRDLLAGLKSLGMTGVTAAEVETALKELGIRTQHEGQRQGVEGSVPQVEAPGYIPARAQAEEPGAKQSRRRRREANDGLHAAGSIVQRIGDERFPDIVIRDGVGQWWSGEVTTLEKQALRGGVVPHGSRRNGGTEPPWSPW